MLVEVRIKNQNFVLNTEHDKWYNEAVLAMSIEGNKKILYANGLPFDALYSCSMLLFQLLKFKPCF